MERLCEAARLLNPGFYLRAAAQRINPLNYIDFMAEIG